MDLAQCRLVTDDVEGLAAFYARLLAVPTALNEYYVEIEAGWSGEQLAEAFAFLALTVFTAYFLNYAQTPMDLPAGPAATGEPE